MSYHRVATRQSRNPAESQPAINMKSLIRYVTHPGPLDACHSFGILLLRLLTGGVMLAAHGWSKLTGFSSMAGQFPDPIGLGSTPSLALVVFAEVFCAAAVILGLFTRAAVIPLVITMLVAFFVVHGSDPFGDKELPLLYATAFLALAFTGAGRYSIDAVCCRR